MNQKIKNQLEQVKVNRNVYYNIMNQLLENNLEQDLINLFFNKVINCEKQIKEYEDWLNLTVITPNNVDEKEKLFLELFSKLKYDESDFTWYNENDKWVIEQDEENKIIWFSYNRFWSIFEENLTLIIMKSKTLYRVWWRNI